MSLQINTFDDLLYIVDTHPEWRRKLVKALFPEIDLPKALQELVESNRLMRVQLGDVEARLQSLDERQARTEERQARTEERQARTEERQARTEDRQAHTEDRQTSMEDRQTRMEGQLTRVEDKVVRLEIRVDRIDGRLGNVEQSVATLKGDSYENMVGKKADAIFGYGLRRGHDGRNEVSALLDAAEQSGQISDNEFIQVLAADLLWSGRLKHSSQNTTLVVEVSWFAEQNDLQRAIDRAAILGRIGVHAIPVVAAREWSDSSKKVAHDNGVIAVQDFSLDKASWEAVVTN